MAGYSRLPLCNYRADTKRFTPYPKTNTVVETSCDRFQLIHPFTAILAGMTGSGKTAWVEELLEHANRVIKPPPQRIVWSYSQWQPAYVYFQGKIMRTLSLNAAYLVLFKNPRDKLQMVTLGEQIYPGKTKQFVQKYEAAVQRSYGYLFVDLKPNTKDECRLRTNVLPNEDHPSQTGGQSEELKDITDFFERQSYLQPPELKIIKELEKRMNAI